MQPDRRRLLVSGGSLIGLGALLSSCTLTGVFSTRDEPAAGDETKGALPIVNALRAQDGLPGLAADKAAQRAAAEQARRMADAGRMSHLIGFNDDFLTRMKRSAVPLPAAENIATGQDTVERAVDAWIRSEKHKLNMLGSYRGLGVAVARSSSSGNRPFWAMVLSG